MFFYTQQYHERLSIDVMLVLKNFANKDRRYFTLYYDKNLRYFDQSQLFEMNGSYSRWLDFSWSEFQELPKINQLDVRELNLQSNRLKKLIDSTNLSTSIEVNRLLPYHVRFLKFKFHSSQ